MKTEKQRLKLMEKMQKTQDLREKYNMDRTMKSHRQNIEKDFK